MRPTASSQNMWFTQAYQREGECKIRGAFTHSSTVVCANNPYGNRDYKSEIYARGAIKALFAFCYGFENYTREFGGNNNSCNTTYCRTKESAEKLKNIIGNITIPFSDESRTPKKKLFDENGDGINGYSVDAQQFVHGEKGLQLIYVKVYEFERPKNGKQADIIRKPTLKPGETAAGVEVKFYNDKGGVITTLDAETCDHNCNYRCNTQMGHPRDIVSIVGWFLGTIIFILLVLLAVAAWKLCRCSK